jgi:DNA-3-methyladenine glycosylase II
MGPMRTRLTPQTLAEAVQTLAARDEALAASVARFGVPPMWEREPSFGTLVHLILEQQVSLASALAAYRRLETASGGTPEPASFLTFDDEELRAIGFSRQKARFARDLAAALADGFDLGALANLDDDGVRAALTGLRGVGRWTADVYLTMCLLRPDVWPLGDRALAVGAAEALSLDAVPGQRDLTVLAERWRPFRAVAARVCWNHYLGVRGRLAAPQG